MNEKSRILKGTLLGGLLTALLLAGVFGLGFLLGPITLSGAFASTPAQTSTNSQPAATGTGAAHHDKQYYMDLLEQNFAANLGVDKAKLDSALAAAVTSTADQAVQNGDITQDQATTLKGAAAKGISSFFDTLSSVDGKTAAAKEVDPDTQQLLNAALNEAATRLGFASRDEMMTASKTNRQTLGEIAQAHNMTSQALQDAMLHAAKSTADGIVASGKWTQAQADDAYSKAANVIPKLINATVDTDSGYTDELAGAGFQAGAQLIGLSDRDFGMLIKGDDKSLAQIAQEHNVTLDALRNTILQAARAHANELVTTGKWTQAQADEAYNGFNNLVQKLSAGPMSGSNERAPANK